MVMLIVYLIELVLIPVNYIIVGNTRVCLVVSITACLVSTIFIIFFPPNTFIMNLSRILFTQVQGSWLIHSSLVSYHHNRKICFLMFTWHILITFILYILMVIITRLIRRKKVKTRRNMKEIGEKEESFSKQKPQK